jgi:hypothetical protein
MKIAGEKGIMTRSMELAAAHALQAPGLQRADDSIC